MNSKRMNKSDWLDIGLHQLANEGAPGLRIELICGVANKSRGSFYHHFVDHPQFCENLLQHWVSQHTEEIISLVGNKGSARQRRHELSRVTAKLNSRVEMGIRAWASTNNDARRAVGRVDERRMNYLADLNREEFGLAAVKARDLAEIEYAAFVGYQTLFPDADEKRLRAMGRCLDGMIAGFAKT